MKAAAFLLALAVTAVQSVAIADCCCIVVCKHREQSCTDCEHKPVPVPKKDDC